MNNIIKILLIMLLIVVITIAVGFTLFMFAYYNEYLSLIKFMSTELMVG